MHSHLYLLLREKQVRGILFAMPKTQWLSLSKWCCWRNTLSQHCNCLPCCKYNINMVNVCCHDSMMCPLGKAWAVLLFSVCLCLSALKPFKSHKECKSLVWKWILKKRKSSSGGHCCIYIVLHFYFLNYTVFFLFLFSSCDQHKWILAKQIIFLWLFVTYLCLFTK